MPRAISELGSSLGEHLREQRQNARLSLRQLADLAGVSNPYLSQIERGLKRPSAEILQQIAKALQVSAESLYVQAGILDGEAVPPAQTVGVRAAIADDPALTDRQRSTLLSVYESFLDGAGPRPAAPRPARSRRGAAGSRALPTRSTTGPATTSRRAAGRSAPGRRLAGKPEANASSEEAPPVAQPPRPLQPADAAAATGDLAPTTTQPQE